MTIRSASQEESGLLREPQTSLKVHSPQQNNQSSAEETERDCIQSSRMAEEDLRKGTFVGALS